MAKKKKKAPEPELDTPSLFESDVVRAIIGILLAAVAVFLGLAAFDAAGAIGTLTYQYLALLLGVGYALLPIAVLLLAVVFFRSFNGQSISPYKLIGTALFLFSSLALLGVLLPGSSGLLGSLIADPLVAAFDVIAASVFLVAFIAVSLITIFEVHPLALITRVKEEMVDQVQDLISGDPNAEKEMEIVAPVTDEEVEEVGEEGHAPIEEVREPVVRTPKDKPVGDEDIPILHATGAIYTPPPVSLLSKNKGRPEVGDVKANANIIKRTLQNFGIEVEMDEVSIGPTVTRYAMKPAEGVRLAKIVALQSNLELALAASPVRIEAPIPGRSLVGIEVPNVSRTRLGLAPLVSDNDFSQSDKPLLMALGRTITGAPHYADMARMPHMLVAGATGAGKSVTLHDLIVSLLYRCGPEQLRFVMVDPKRVELTLYNSIPHLLTPVITEPKKAILALKWLTKEMERRYDVLETEQVRDIASYHKNVLHPALKHHNPDSEEKLPEPMPYIVVIIDELADIMQTFPRELEAGIVRLAQMSRAVGIHLVLSTQRPSVKVITGLIKANVPARLALQVASQIDSRTILDTGGAEKLLGAGDMLFLSGDMAKPIRVQAPYIPEEEVKRVVKWIADHYDHLEDEIDFSQSEASDAMFSGSIGGSSDDADDDLYEEAKAAVIDAGKASTSYLQRKLRVGYSRAARLIDILEDRGVIGPQDGSKPREVLAGGAADIDTDDVNERPDDPHADSDDSRV